MIKNLFFDQQKTITTQLIQNSQRKKGERMSEGKKHIGYQKTSFPVKGVEATSYEDLGGGLVKESETAWAKNKEEATERLLEKEANKRLNR